MIEDRVKVLIREFNPWWEGKRVNIPEYKRHIFAKIEKYLPKKQIIAIVGLRRVGKSTLMYQLIGELLTQGIKKENIFYFLFDEIIAQKPEVLEDILNYYLKVIARDGRKYIFLDEVHKVPYWQDIIKRFYDLRDDLKFFVSGSSSLQIKKTKESLAGRLFDFYLPILTFREFLEMKGLEIEKINLDFEDMKKFYEKNIHKLSLFEEALIEYIFKGGFPEIVLEEDNEIIRNYIKSSVIEKIIFEDIPSVFEIRRRDMLYSIFEYCCKETSNLLDITKLANILEVNYHTTKSYLFYLQHSFLIDIVFNYSESFAKQLRKNKKVHIAHPSIAIGIMKYPKEILEISEITSRYVETIVFQHVKAKEEKIFFWRTPQKEEVDIVIGKIPVEIKFKRDITMKDIKGLIKFMKRFKVREGIVVTKGLFERKNINGKEIIFIPAWLFLLIS